MSVVCCGALRDGLLQRAIDSIASCCAQVFGFGRQFGIHSAVGVEVPLGITYPFANGTEKEHFEGALLFAPNCSVHCCAFVLASSEAAYALACLSHVLAQEFSLV